MVNKELSAKQDDQLIDGKKMDPPFLICSFLLETCKVKNHHIVQLDDAMIGAKILL